MKKLAAVALVLVVLAAPLGCYGPRRVTRQLDDWTNQKYVETPWLIGNVISTALIGVAFMVTGMVDSVWDAYTFWIEDAQPIGDGKGTPFNHKNPTKP